MKTNLTTRFCSMMENERNRTVLAYVLGSLVICALGLAVALAVIQLVTGNVHLGEGQI